MYTLTENSGLSRDSENNSVKKDEKVCRHIIDVTDDVVFGFLYY